MAAFGTPAVDFGYFLNRKYAILQQQADAGSEQARATTTNAATNAVVGAASAGLDNTRARLMPAESASAIALQSAQARLAGEQASVIAPESAARIAGMSADTALTTTNNRVLTRERLTPIEELFGGSSRVPSLTAGQPFRFQPAAPLGGSERRRAGESEAAWLDRINGL